MSLSAIDLEGEMPVVALPALVFERNLGKCVFYERTLFENTSTWLHGVPHVSCIDLHCRRGHSIEVLIIPDPPSLCLIIRCQEVFYF